jgi:hypothetical protein
MDIYFHFVIPLIQGTHVLALGMIIGPSGLVKTEMEIKKE